MHITDEATLLLTDNSSVVSVKFLVLDRVDFQLFVLIYSGGQQFPDLFFSHCDLTKRFYDIYQANDHLLHSRLLLSFRSDRDRIQDSSYFYYTIPVIFSDVVF